MSRQHFSTRDRVGYVYVLSNPSMPGVVKIGRSRHGAAVRARSLSGTAVPVPFVVEFEILCLDVERAEERAHRYANKSRVSASREFFELSVRDAVGCVIDAAWVDWEQLGDDSAPYVAPEPIVPAVKTAEERKVSRQWIADLRAILEESAG